MFAVKLNHNILDRNTNRECKNIAIERTKY